jgi:DNA mismatch endonuclease (patch repair protein)
MASVKSKDTTPELVVRHMVHAMGFRFRLHVESLPGRPDLVFASRRRIIFVSGCFWHMHSCGRCRIPHARRDYWTAKLNRNRLRDRRTRARLRRMGWAMLVIWECQTTPRNRAKMATRLRRFLD